MNPERKLFTCNGRAIDALPPTQAALYSTSKELYTNKTLLEPSNDCITTVSITNYLGMVQNCRRRLGSILDIITRGMTTV